MNYRTHGQAQQSPRRLLTTLLAICLPILAATFVSGSFFKMGTLRAGEVLDVSAAHAAGHQANGSAQAPANGFTVYINEGGFLPAGATVKPGTTIVWVNSTARAQTLEVTSPVMFSSDALAPGQSFAYTFVEAGAYPFKVSGSSAQGTITVADVPNAILDVNIQLYQFQPQSITINAGDTVRWTNLDSDRHTATADNGTFNSPELDLNQTWQFTFSTPGTYGYYCARHTAMRGTIVVNGAPATTTSTAQATGTTTAVATGTGTAVGTTTGTTTAVATGTTTPGATGTGTAVGTITGTPQAGCTPTGNIGISITDSSFNPSSVTVSPGTRVTWTNNGTQRHRVRDINHNLFDSDDLSPGQSFSYTFCNPGTYQYEDARSGFTGVIYVSGTPATGTTTAVATGTGTAQTTRTGTPGGTGTPQVTGTPGGVVNVQIINEEFVPANITVQAGTTVRWTNFDDDEHTVTSAGNFNSGTLNQGQSYQFTFTTNGTYSYFCAFHSDMLGSVTVVGGSSTPTPAVTNTPVAGNADVAITNFAFVPASLTIQVGTTVRWTNNDPYPHTATADNSAFNSGTLNQGQTYQFTFTTPGTYGYYCAIHPAMRGTIVVTSGGGGTSTPQVTQTAQATGTAQATSTRTGTGTPQASQTAQATGTAQATATWAPGQRFSDVTPSDYFFVAVGWLVERGIISGYSDGTFRPFNNTTRGQLTKMVVLGEGWGVLTPPQPTFSDVPTNHPFYGYVETAVARGIISGYADGTFRAGNNVTRGQLTKIVVLGRGWVVENPPTATFSDVGVGSVYYQYVETAVLRGIISGYSDSTFRPFNNATRGQVSKILYNALNAP